eukprot:scaffold170_cov281-Pinguiococcus_pyrenoidosus.AAC.3
MQLDSSSRRVLFRCQQSSGGVSVLRREDRSHQVRWPLRPLWPGWERTALEEGQRVRDLVALAGAERELSDGSAKWACRARCSGAHQHSFADANDRGPSTEHRERAGPPRLANGASRDATV